MKADTIKRLASGALAGALLMAGALAALPSTAGAAGHHTKPGSFTATETLANTAVVLSWTVPASNGGGTLSYQVAARQRRTSVACVPTGPTSCILTGLQNLHPVTGHIIATNSGGSSRTYFAAIPNTVQNCNYIGEFANLQGCIFQYTGALTGVNLTGADLQGAVLNDLNLAGTTLTGADLSGATLEYLSTNGQLIGAPRALPTGWAVSDGWLFGPSNGATYAGNLTGTVFSPTDLSGANFIDSDFAGSDFRAVTSFSGTNLSYDNLSSSNFTGVNLTGALISSTDLEGANLTGATLNGDDLTNADLTGATLSGAALAGVTWANTTCPDGSNSDTDGGTCIGFGI